jgi:hypothetical protein
MGASAAREKKEKQERAITSESFNAKRFFIADRVERLKLSFST